MTRIVLLGCAGTGKTTFARRLFERTGAPVIDLDALWRAQGAEDHGKFRETLRTLHAADAWISDGNFAALTFDIRLPRADLIVWLERPRWLCSLRAIRRAFGGDAHHRLKDLGDVLRFIRNFDRVNRPLIEQTRTAIAPDVRVVHLADARRTRAFLADPGIFPPAAAVQ